MSDVTVQFQFEVGQRVHWTSHHTDETEQQQCTIVRRRYTQGLACGDGIEYEVLFAGETQAEWWGEEYFSAIETAA